VRDDGKGVPEQIVSLRPGSIGVGIGGMRQRAKEFGGELRMQSAAPGTIVEVTIPVTPDILRLAAAAASESSWDEPSLQTSTDI